MSLNEKIANLAQEALSDEGQFLLEVVISSKHGPKKVTVIIDGDKGIMIEDCAALSRKLVESLEEPGLMDEGFTLEVTTPGIDHPLKLKRQYVKNIGRSLKVQMTDKKIETGKLVEVTDEAITLEQEVKEKKKAEHQNTVLQFSEIERAIVQVSFK